MIDEVNHPSWYSSNPSGVECIDVVSVLPNDLGNAVKYVWRHGMKWDEMQDLRKSEWYLRHIVDSDISDGLLMSAAMSVMDVYGVKYTEWSTMVRKVISSWDDAGVEPMSGFFDSLCMFDVEGMLRWVGRMISDLDGKGADDDRLDADGV